MKVYLAGPLGFSETGRHFLYQVIVPKFEQLGYTVLDPWTLTDQAFIDAITCLPYGQEKRDAWQKLNIVIGDNNRQAIDECDIIFAVLDGVDIDSGTAAEIGYGFALKKKILGYRGDFRLSADNEGSTVNLQVEYFIRQSGGDIISQMSEVEQALKAL